MQDDSVPSILQSIENRVITKMDHLLLLVHVAMHHQVLDVAVQHSAPVGEAGIQTQQNSRQTLRFVDKRFGDR